MVERRTWEEFRAAGLLWWVNRILHIFGWAICVELDGVVITEAYPVHCKFRGFCEDSETEGHRALTAHMADEIERIGSENANSDIVPVKREVWERVVEVLQEASKVASWDAHEESMELVRAVLAEIEEVK